VCFRVPAFPIAGSFINNVCRGVFYCFNEPGWGDYEIGSTSASAIVQGNRCATAGAEGMPPLAFATANSSTRPAMMLQYPVTRTNALGGGSWSWSGCDANNLTSVNFAECVLYQLRGSWAISAKTNPDRQGDEKIFITDTAGSAANGAFATPWGLSYEARPNDVFRVITDKDGVERLVYERGRVMQHIGPLTAQSAAIGTTAIFGGNPAGGLYEVCFSLSVTDAGSAGTADVNVGWNNGVGAQTKTVPGLDNVPLDAASVGDGCVLVETDGSADITYGVPWTGASGTIEFKIRGTVAMKQ
jgi:hypothetical protein